MDPNLSEIPVATPNLHAISEVDEDDKDEEDGDENAVTCDLESFDDNTMLKKRKTNPLMFAASDYLENSNNSTTPSEVSSFVSRAVSSLTIGLSDSGASQNPRRKTSKDVKRLSTSLHSFSRESTLSTSSRASTTICVPGSDKIIFKCDTCGTVSSNKSGFTRHKCNSSANSTKHSDQTISKCDQCDKVCLSLSGLKRHKSLVHEKKGVDPSAKKPATPVKKTDEILTAKNDSGSQERTTRSAARAKKKN